MRNHRATRQLIPWAQTIGLGAIMLALYGVVLVVDCIASLPRKMAELRRDWKSLLGKAVTIALFWGTVIAAVLILPISLAVAAAIPVTGWVASPLWALAEESALLWAVTWRILCAALTIEGTFPAFFGLSAIIEYVLYRKAKNMILAFLSTVIGYGVAAVYLRYALWAMYIAFPTGQKFTWQWRAAFVMTTCLLAGLACAIFLGTAIRAQTKLFAWSEEQKHISVPTVPESEEIWRAAT